MSRCTAAYIRMATTMCFLASIAACELETIDRPAAVAPPAVIGITGGTVEVLDPSSTIAGARVVIPPGALYEDTLITIEPAELPGILPAPYRAAGPAVAFGATGTNFNVPVEIFLPYNDADQNGYIDDTTISEAKANLFYFNPATAGWESLTVTGRDAGGNLVCARTPHFSTYLVPVDTTEETADPAAGEDFVIGEYFVGENRYEFDDAGNGELILYGCLEQNRLECLAQDNCRRCGTPYVLTMRPEVSATGPILVGVIDRFTTLSGGYPVTLDPGGTYATFDVSDDSRYFPFDKLNRSGSAEVWEWTCEYVADRTILRDYESCGENDEKTLCTESDERIYCDISGSGTQVRIDFGIDLSELTNNGIPVPNFTIGDFGLLAIAFEARYIGER